ncbi:metabolite traffic protein EboE [Plantactinospora mayteni]|uniref:Xylose isomerase n=1 Tax=Plantactinospora mayteni TaxID=566021 RepID=A0ABQ4ER22_9ACTN|nr:metabolite traffic protein EboE [Plantactinospora mayteni]GIG97134.1 xylose isomerase [Plantactinospora mayteni]
MRFRHPDGTVVHLAYCANVPAATDLDDVLAQLTEHAEPVRRKLGLGVLGLGLWLSPPVASALVEEPRQLIRLRAELAARGLAVVTLNGASYADLSAPTVKREAYAVDWSHPRRLAYTLTLVRCLARLLPDDVPRGSVSTLPVGWRRPWFPEHEQAAFRHLAALPVGLRQIAEDEGKPVRVGFEPGAGCVLETTDDVVRLLDVVDREWIGICLDTCHHSLTFEEPGEAVRRLDDAGLPVVKAQISGALSVPEPGSAAVRPALRALAEPRFLHQVRERSVRGVRGVDDLDEALDGRHRLPARGAWRVHYHLPVHGGVEPPFESTVDVAAGALRALLGNGRAGTDQIEIETYTWSLRPDPTATPDPSTLVAGLAAELDWTRRQLLGLGLVPLPA